MPKKQLKDFRQQRRNANKHTPRGMGMLDTSISKLGWIGAVTAAADGEIFDGSARHEVSCDRFGEEVEPIIVESDGSRPVVVVRKDIPTAEDPRAKELAVLANRIAEVDLNFDPDELKALDDELEISKYWFEDEWAKIQADVPDFQPVGMDEQGRLDQKEDKEVECECPKCGHKFTKLL